MRLSALMRYDEDEQETDCNRNSITNWTEREKLNHANEKITWGHPLIITPRTVAKTKRDKDTDGSWSEPKRNSKVWKI